MKYLIPLFIILLIPFVIAISDDAGNRIDFKYDSPTFDNNTAYVNNSAGWLEMDAFNATQMDDGADSQTLNIKESWVRGLVNAATKWIIDVPGGYLYNDSTTIYFNGTELNKTIDQRVTGAGDNSSWNESYADTLYSNITWNYNQTLGAEVYTNSTNSTLASWIEELFIKISDVVSYVGNWSADKDSYYNTTQIDNGTYTSTYNATYDNYKTNVSLNWSLLTAEMWNESWISTYNATYDSFVDTNETDRVDSLNSTIINSNASWLTTYNETYDGYNSTGLILDYNESGFIYDYNETGLLIDYNGSGFIYDYNESNLIINHTIETFNLWDTRWISTQNDTYDTCVNNASYLLISNETERVNSLNLTKYEENDNASFYNVTAENTIVGNNFISTIGAGDVLFVDPFNNNTNIWRASTGSSDYGFYMQYYGAGSGNANSLRLYTEGQLGTDVWVWDITQDGKADFKQDFESSGSITATTNVYSGYAGTFGSVASDVHIDAGGGGTIFLDATNTYGGDANFDSYAEHSVALEIPQERTALSYFTTTAEDRTYLKDGVLTYNHTNKDDELLYSIKELETCENTTLIDNRTGDKEEDYIKEGCVTEQIETKSISNLVELLRDAIFELKTENDKIKDCAKNSPDYSKYQTCIAGVEMVGL